MRKPNIRLWTRRLTLTAREAPAEMLLALYFFAIYSLNREHVLNDPTDYLLLMPIFFALSLLTNRWCRSPRSRIVYRLSPLATVPFLWADVGGWVHSVAYPVTLIVSALTVFAGGWQRDNARFVERVLRYLSDAIASGLIALAAFLASCAIFFSIVYIFNILDDCSRGFTEYAAMASLLVVWPVLFLILDRDSERDQGNGFASGPFLDVLSNYILTPALLIYTAILYLYFAKIAIGWSLPKGGIAYLVFGYTITALVVQASQTLLQRRRYDWYYRRFGPIALPALAMFWIGVLYRVHQYGFTEARAYLVVCGAVMTLTVLMQFDRRTARYLYATVTGAALLALFTYVPGMTAADIGVRSQSVRADRLIDRLELADPTGRLTLARLTHADSTQKKDLRNLYESLEYLRDERGEEYLRARYGIGTERALLDEVVPERFREYVEYGWEGEVDTIAVDGDVTLERGAEAVDLSGYSKLYPLQNYGDSRHTFYRTNDDTLYVEQSDRILFRLSLRDMLAGQLEDMPYSPHGTISVDSLRNGADRLLEYRRDSVRLIFRRIVLDRQGDGGLRILDLDMDYYLIR